MFAPSTDVRRRMAAASNQVSRPSTSLEGNDLDQLSERLAESMSSAWQRGERVPAEEYLAQHAELARHPPAAIRLIYEEVCQRQEMGEEVPFSEMQERFPQWQSELKILLDCHHLVDPRDAPLFPKVGESLGAFRLLAELERGAFGRVFLATEPELADRPVVLKMTPCGDGHEHLSLARLQHTHIVPLYSVQDYPDRNLRAMCMPYLGGMTLAHILHKLQNRPPTRRTGQDFLDALDASPTNRLLPFPSHPFPFHGPARQFLAKASYVQAICWIGVCLADALRYAHERGLVHLDIKPGNVLMAADGQPMLLDFHLARAPVRPDGARLDWIGGTREYMSPEQRAALKAVKHGRVISTGIDERSDLYSLGLVLYEALTGCLPEPDVSLRPTISQLNPQVSLGLSDIIAKCLCPDPNGRYADAVVLATDLRRHLADLPLRGVANRSLKERWRKWRRRRPYMLAGFGMVLTAVAAILAGSALVMNRHAQQQKESRTFQAYGQESLEKGEFDEAAQHFTRALTIAEAYPPNKSLQQDIGVQLQLAQRGQALQRLHVLAEQLRFLAGAESLPPKRLQAVEESCRKIWKQRSRLMDRSLGKLDAAIEDRLQSDLLDVAMIWAGIRVQSALSEQKDLARREALDLLAEAEKVFGAGLVLCRERQDLAEALGLKELAQEAAKRARRFSPKSSWERLALGRRLLRQGQVFLASAEFQKAVELEPESFWANFYQGLSAYRLRQYPEAISAFRSCISVAPECAECYYNRGRTYMASGQNGPALQDYDRALELKPDLADAALNRGILHYREKRYAEAAADIRESLKHGADATAANYNAALVELARNQRPAALKHLEQALQSNPGHKESRALREQLQIGAPLPPS